jgi:hypothetical protein
MLDGLRDGAKDGGPGACDGSFESAQGAAQ